MLAEQSYLGFIPVTDVAAARHFYVELLGLELRADTPFALIVRSGSTELRLTPVPGLKPQPFTVAGWEVDDIDTVAGELMAVGIEGNRYDAVADSQDEHGIWTAPNGDRVLWFSDPDGNILSISSHA